METGLPKLLNDTNYNGDSLSSLLIDGPPVPDIGSTVVISNCQVEPSSESPSKAWTGKRVLCSFSSNSNDLDEYPFHAVTYGEPGELLGLPYNDHNYAKIQDDEGNNENQLALLAKLALAKHDSSAVIELPQSDCPKVFETHNIEQQKSASDGVAPSSVGPNVSQMTIFKSQFVGQCSTQSLPFQPPLTASTCKVAASNGRTILLTPPRGSLGASVQIHRVSSMNAPHVLVRTDLNSSNDRNVINGSHSAVSNSIRCICGFTRDDGCLVQCANCKILQHAGCMAPSSNNILPKPYFCELCHPRPVMVSEAVSLQQRKMAAVNKVRLPAKTIRLTNPGTYRLPRTHTPIQSHNPTLTSNRLFLAGNGSSQGTTTTLSVRPIQVRLGDVGSSTMGATLYHVDSATLNQFPPRIINFDASAGRQQTQPAYVTAVAGGQRASKRKQDLLTLAGEPASHFNSISSGYTYEDPSVSNDQHVVTTPNDHIISSTSESNDLPGPKFYRTPSQAMIGAGGLDSVEGSKPHIVPLASSFGEVTTEVSSAAAALTSCVPEPASPDVVIWSDSYEKATETRLSDALKQRIRNIFLTPSERELRTLKMADSSALSRGQQRCRVANPEVGRKGLIATENIYPNQPVIEYKGYAMLMDEYSQQHDYRRYYNPFVLFYKQLDKAVICLDASDYGNEARFIRRSCMPNCEVRLTFPPTDSFSSVVNPQCIQFVVTSAVNRVLPAGTELTVAFDFDYTACSYPVRCACARGPPLCAVADWFRRHKSRHVSQREDSFGEIGDADKPVLSSVPSHHFSPEPFDDENEGPDDRYGRMLVPRRGASHSHVADKSRNRISMRRVIAPKRVSPAFSRVPYPSAKHMVQEQQQQHRRNQLLQHHQSVLGEAVAKGTKDNESRKRGGGRGGGVGRKRGARSGLVRGPISTSAAGNNVLRRPNRPRGRPPNSSIKRQVQRQIQPLILQSPLSRPVDDDDVADDDVFYSSPRYSSSPRTDATEPGATSPWFYGVRSPQQSLKSQRHGVASKQSVRKLQLKSRRRRRMSEMLVSPSTVNGRRARRRSSVDTLSPVRDEAAEMDAAGEEDPNQSGLEDKPPQHQTLGSKKRSRKHSGRIRNGFVPHDSTKPTEPMHIPSSAKRARRQSDMEAIPPGEQGDGLETKTHFLKDQTSPVRSNKSREDNWLAEVLRRIERMEKNNKKPKKSKRDKYHHEAEIDSSSKSPLSYTNAHVENSAKQADEVDEAKRKESGSQTPNSRRQRRRSTPSIVTTENTADAVIGVVPPSAPPLSREDRWMRMQLQRIAEMESVDPVGLVDTDVATTTRHRRRASSSGKPTVSTLLAPSFSSPKKDANAEGEEECSLIVYKRRDQDPMAKFSRSRTVRDHESYQALHHAVTRTFSLVETVVDDENLPAGGELLDDHTMGASNATTTTLSDSMFLAAPPQSPPKPSKKRWLSQALMEEDQQRQHAHRVTPPSPESSVTPPPPPSDQQQQMLNSFGGAANSTSKASDHHQRAINPKKRIISQIEEELMAQQQHQQEQRNQVTTDADIVSAAKLPTSCDKLLPTSPSKLPPKKRQTDEGANSNSEAVAADTVNTSSSFLKQQKQEKVRMSLSEYRRRRGMSNPSIETQTKSQASQAPGSTSPIPQSAPPLHPGTPPGSPLVDLKRLLPTPSLLPPPSVLPTTFPSTVALCGPRTPSEPSSDEDDNADAVGKASLPPSPPPPAPVVVPNRLSDVERVLVKSTSLDAFENRQISPHSAISGYRAHHPPPTQGGFDRHLSGHAYRRASPPPPPSLKTSTSPPSNMSTISPTSLPPLSENILRRDQEIRQWQRERQQRQHSSSVVHHSRHHALYQQTSQHQGSALRSSTSSNSGGPVGGLPPLRHDQPRPASSHTPPPCPTNLTTPTQQPRTQRNTSSSPLRSHTSAPQTVAVLAGPSSSTVTTSTAFNHTNMESIQETLRLKNEHLRAQLRDLQKATAGGGV